jgi:hypothetical protein
MGLLGAGGLPALLLMLFQGAGFTPQKIESMAGDVANGVGKDLARDIMQKHAAEISKKAQAEGWLVGNVKATTANPSPHELKEHEVIRDIEWRLWRSVFAVHGGGRIADGFRDSQEQKVGAIVEAEWDGTQATYDQMVQWVLTETINLTFKG